MKTELELELELDVVDTAARESTRLVRQRPCHAGVVKMFKQIHQDVERKSREFYDVLRRYNYVTPTSYLELLSSFDTLLQYKRGEVATKKNRLKIGLDKIISTGELVEGMQKVRDAALKLKLNLNS